ncbi:MAG: hypothetical protein ACRD50_07975 [Candidatus Acidiferrales bacterium]
MALFVDAPPDAESIKITPSQFAPFIVGMAESHVRGLEKGDIAELLRTCVVDLSEEARLAAFRETLLAVWAFGHTKVARELDDENLANLYLTLVSRALENHFQKNGIEVQITPDDFKQAWRVYSPLSPMPVTLDEVLKDYPDYVIRHALENSVRQHGEGRLFIEVFNARFCRALDITASRNGPLLVAMFLSNSARLRCAIETLEKLNPDFTLD